MRKLTPLVLGTAVSLAAGCKDEDQHQPPAITTPVDASPEAEPQIEGTVDGLYSPVDRVYATSILLNNHINYYRRLLTDQLGERDARRIHDDCSDAFYSKELSVITDKVTARFTNRQMEPCFQDGDYDYDCLDGTLFQNLGPQYIEYMQLKNEYGRQVAECLQQVVYPKNDRPYDEHGDDPFSKKIRNME
jgi:hypothetical protein